MYQDSYDVADTDFLHATIKPGGKKYKAFTSINLI